MNSLQRYGRWAFAEFTDVFDIEAGFADMIGRTVTVPKTGEHSGYEGLDFKELLAVAPLEGIDLARLRDIPREIEL